MQVQTANSAFDQKKKRGSSSLNFILPRITYPLSFAITCRTKTSRKKHSFLITKQHSEEVLKTFEKRSHAVINTGHQKDMCY